MRYYEDLPVGRFHDFDQTYLLTEDEIREMGERWDPQPFHTDPVAAAASVFGGLVASTVHLFAIVVRVGMHEEPPAAVSSLGIRTMDNHAPARPGDILSLCTTVLAARLSQSRPGVGVVTFRSELTNQRDELIFSFENSALIECTPDLARLPPVAPIPPDVPPA